jgi:hypothetical protein
LIQLVVERESRRFSAVPAMIDLQRRVEPGLLLVHLIIDDRRIVEGPAARNGGDARQDANHLAVGQGDTNRFVQREVAVR